MSEKLKKILVVALAVMMAFAMCACGNKSEEAAETEETDGVANPFVEVENTDELCQATNVSLDAPEGAENVSYCYCKNEDGSIDFAQVKFTYDGDVYCYRCKDAGAVTDITVTIEENGNAGDLMAQLQDCSNIGAALAGMYYDWEGGGLITVQNRDGVFALNEGGPGFIAWIDVVPGFLYSLSTDKGATQQKLMDVADKTFVEMQGNS